MSTDFSQQYALVCGARQVVLNYCATFSPEQYVAPIPAFNGTSVRDLLVHIVRTYRSWLGEVGLGQPAVSITPAEVPDVETSRGLFGDVDVLVTEFERHFAARWLVPGTFAVPSRPAPLQLTPLQLFTHVITHEFHHKGQILSMGRLLGHVPPDADIIRPDQSR